MSGVIYCGDNLQVLREFIPDASVDLVYLDPPFNSQRDYHVVYKDSPALQHAFKDCWSWEEAAPEFEQLMHSADVPKAVKPMLQALKGLLIEDDRDLLAYLTMMTPRLVAMHAALKPTGSLYLHCDPTASHYLKVLLDSVFGLACLQNEIIWKRTSAHNSAKRYGPVHDVILFYSKSSKYTWNPAYQTYDPDYVATFFDQQDADGRRWKRGDLTGPGVRAGDSGTTWRGIDVTAKGRHWQPASYVYDRYKKLTGEELGSYPLMERLDKMDALGMLHWPDKKSGVPRYKCYLEDMPGTPAQDVWMDIRPLHNLAEERTGYPTQKPLTLLERIIRASSNPGDVVLDPFCGCGTTVEAAEKLGRRWIGIDIARTAVDVIESRFEKVELPAPKVIWHPADEQAARELAKRDKLEFERWALRKVKASKQRKHDRGIDGESHYQDGSKSYHVLVSVKGGAVNPAMVRDLVGTVHRMKADVGVMVSLLAPSKEMKREAVEAGYLPVSDDKGPIPRIQIVTVEQLFADGRPVRVRGENRTVMPKKSIPPMSGAQLSLEMEPGTANDNGRGKSKKPSMPGPRKTSPAPAATKTKSKPPAKRQSSR